MARERRRNAPWLVGPDRNGGDIKGSQETADFSEDRAVAGVAGEPGAVPRTQDGPASPEGLNKIRRIVEVPVSSDHNVPRLEEPKELQQGGS